MSTLTERIMAVRARYGTYKSSHEALGVITEEYHELISAIRANARSSVYEEALDLAACALKLAEDCIDMDFQERSGM
jgi:NTP pyrophosphatase (non-canonical NTP hydrolase)